MTIVPLCVRRIMGSRIRYVSSSTETSSTETDHHSQATVSSGAPL